jgi:hypothetical protein
MGQLPKSILTAICMPMCLNIRLLLALSQNNFRYPLVSSMCIGSPQSSAIGGYDRFIWSYGKGPSHTP